MKEYKIMTHNSMSYLPPRQWWMRPFRFLARTQRLSLLEQYTLGVRVFDIRVRPSRRIGWVLAHGAMEFKCKWSLADLFEILDADPSVRVRLLLEISRRHKDVEAVSNQFRSLCDVWRKMYPNITFFEFRRKYDWKKLYTYDGEPEPTMHQAVGSMAGRRLLGWWPWLYAWLNNKDILAQGTDKDILAVDFLK